MKKKGKAKYTWHGYDMGHFGIGLAPLQMEDKSEHIALWVTVGEDAFPLAIYPDEETAKEGQKVLDSAIEALEDLHEDEECCKQPEKPKTSAKDQKKKAAAGKAAKSGKKPAAGKAKKATKKR